MEISIYYCLKPNIIEKLNAIEISNYSKNLYIIVTFNFIKNMLLIK